MPYYPPATAAPASKIATSSTPVDIGTTPPTAGQVLTASSATASGWATPAGGASGLISLASTYTLTTTMTNIPSFSWALGAGTTYEFWFEPTVSTATTSLRAFFGANYTGTLTTQSSKFIGGTQGTLSYYRASTGSAASWNSGAGPGATAGEPNYVRFSGVLTTNTSGTFTFQAMYDNGTGTITMPPPCFARVFQL